MLSGCQSKETAGITGDDAPFHTPTPVLMSMHFMDSDPYDPHYWRSAPSWGDDPVSLEITRLTGVTLFNVANENELDVFPASGDLPDVVITFDTVMMENSGDCWDWDTLAPQAAPAFWNSLSPEEKAVNMAADGKMYTLRVGHRDQKFAHDARATGFPQQYAPSLFIRQDLLDAYNIPMPDSIEALDAAFRQVKDSMDAAFSPVFSIFPWYDSYQLYQQNPIWAWMGLSEGPYWDHDLQRVQAPWRDEGWLEGVLLMRQWVADGLAELYGSEEYFTSWIPHPRAFAQSIIPNISHVNPGLRRDSAGGFTDRGGPYFALVSSLTYKGEDRFRPDAQRYVFLDDQSGRGFFISKNSEHADRAMELVAFLHSEEGQRLTSWGIEGVHYTLDDTGYLQYEEVFKKEARIPYIIGDIYGNDGIGQWEFLSSAWAIAIRYGAYQLDYGGIEYMEDMQIVHEAQLHYKMRYMQARIPALEAINTRAHPSFRKLNETWHRAMEAMMQAPTAEDAELMWYAFLGEVNNDAQVLAMENDWTQDMAAMCQRFEAAGADPGIEWEVQ